MAINWPDLVPEKVAIDQMQWERRRAIRRMRAIGWSPREIGAKCSISTDRVLQICRKRERSSPVVQYMRETRDVRALAGNPSSVNV